MKLSVIYARVSTEKQEKQETINSQLEALREFAKSNNYTIVNEYLDEGYSGAILDRPSLDKLRDDATKKSFETVLIHSPDRLARLYPLQWIIQEELKKQGINIVFLNRPDSKDTPEDNLLVGVQGLIAEYEKAKILERTRRGKLQKAKQGVLISSVAPYGYKYIPKDKNKEGHYEIVEREAQIVKLIFDLFLNKCMSVRATAKELTQRNIKPRKGIQWRASTLHRLLRNEIYIGIAYYNKHYCVEPQKSSQPYRKRQANSLKLRSKEQWIPIILPENLRIIDKEIFEFAQVQLKRNSEINPRTTKHHYLLQGLLVCGNCGSSYAGINCHGTLYYRCGNRHKTFPLPPTCRFPSIKAFSFEEKVWDTLCEALQDPNLMIEKITEYYRDLIGESQNANQKLQEIENKIKSLSEHRNRMLDAYSEGIISKEDLRIQMNKIEEEKNTLIQRKHTLVKRKDLFLSLDEIKQNINEYCQQVKPNLELLSFDERRKLLKVLVDKITIKSKNQAIVSAIIPIPSNQKSLRVLCTNQTDDWYVKHLEMDLVVTV